MMRVDITKLLLRIYKFSKKTIIFEFFNRIPLEYIRSKKQQSLKVLGVYFGELDALRTKLLAYTVGDYIGNPDRSLKDYLQVYFGDNAARLLEVKRKYDPQNFFQFEQGIDPNGR